MNNNPSHYFYDMPKIESVLRSINRINLLFIISMRFTQCFIFQIWKTLPIPAPSNSDWLPSYLLKFMSCELPWPLAAVLTFLGSTAMVAETKFVSVGSENLYWPHETRERKEKRSLFHSDLILTRFRTDRIFQLNGTTLNTRTWWFFLIIWF